jgi:amino acid transporter
MVFQEAIDRHLFARRHTALLVAIVALFAVRPFLGDSAPAEIAFSLTMLVVLLLALLTIHVDDLIGEREVLLVERRRRIAIGWALAIPAIAERMAVFYAPSQWLIQTGALSWLLFFSYVTWSQLRSLLKQREVTSETISMSISIYLLLGLCWTLLYIVIYTRHPEAFHLDPPPGPKEASAFPVFVYFSFTTLSTIGYGDIVPLTLPARYAAVAEGITGQFYLAILVARLVGMQMTRTAAAPPTDRRGESPDP